MTSCVLEAGDGIRRKKKRVKVKEKRKEERAKSKDQRKKKRVMGNEITFFICFIFSFYV